MTRLRRFTSMRLARALSTPLMRRVAFHLRRIRTDLDIHFFRALVTSVSIIVVVAALLVTATEPDKRSLAGLARSLYWAVTMVIGSGDASYVSGVVGYVVGWLLAFFGVAMVAALTAAVAGFVIDFILREGQGMGAAGYTDHIVVCGWNTTARELIDPCPHREEHFEIAVAPDILRHSPG